MSAAFTGHKAEGAAGALDVIAQSGGGAAVLALATVGMFAYAAWRLFEGFYGLRTNPHSSLFINLINGYVVSFTSAFLYIVFGVSNIYTIIRGQREETANITGALVRHTAGRILLTIAAVILWCVAIAWIVLLLQRNFIRLMDPTLLKRVPRSLRAFIYIIGVVGTVGRVILFILLGVLIIRVTWVLEGTDAGFGQALSQIQTNVAGQIALLIIGFMLIIFGLYSMVLARFKEFLPYKPHLLPETLRDNVRAKMDRFWLHNAKSPL